MRKLMTSYLNKSNPKDLNDSVAWRRWRVFYAASSITIFLASFIAAISYNYNLSKECTFVCDKPEVHVFWLLVVVGIALIIGNVQLPRLYRYLHPKNSEKTQG